MPSTLLLRRPLFRLTTTLTLCVLALGATPCPGQSEGATEVGDGPAVVALRELIGDLRSAAAAGELMPAAAEAAEELWLEQQTDLIRTEAELQILELRAQSDCPSVAEVARLIVERERRAFQRLEQMRGLDTGQAGPPPAAALPELTDEDADDEEGGLRLRISSEPEDLTENPTP